MWMCRGVLFFSLDETYIEMALADQIRLGNFGINLHEASDPASSILWPFVMVVTQSFGLGVWGITILNTIISLVSTYFVLDILDHAKVIDLQRFPLLSWTIALLSVFIISGVALPFVGLEHCLHVLLAVIVLRGLIQIGEGEKPSLLLLAAIVLMPLVRYEGLAFSLVALAALSLLGFWRSALVAGGLIAGALAIDVAFLVSLGLPALPSSVLLKSNIASQAMDHVSPVLGIVHNIKNSLNVGSGQYIFVMGAVIAVIAFVQRRTRPRLSLVQGVVVCAILAHIFFGRYHWWFRYEVYILAIAGLTAIHAIATSAPETGDSGRYARWLPLLILAYPVAFFGFAAVRTPAAARNIYEQQYQMRRFAQDYFKGPVGVNDLGLVSYGNKNYVLDLWGLGSEPVRKDRLAGTFTHARMEQLAKDNNVGLVMIYDTWFKQGVPNSWTQVAVLHTLVVSVASGNVSFYITDPDELDRVVAQLEKFKATLPPEDTLTIGSQPALPLKQS